MGNGDAKILPDQRQANRQAGPIDVIDHPADQKKQQRRPLNAPDPA